MSRRVGNQSTATAGNEQEGETIMAMSENMRQKTDNTHRSIELRLSSQSPRKKTLTDREAAVLNAVKLDADEPVALIAKKLDISVTRLRSTLRKLEDQHLIRYYPFINIYALGYVNYLFYFTPARSLEDKLLRALQEDRRVSWCARFSGRYTYCASFSCRTPLECEEILIELGRRHRATFHESVLQIQTRLTMFSSKYLTPRTPDFRYVTWGAVRELDSIDELDHKILNGLITLSYRSKRELARLLDLPHSTVDDRIYSLMQRKVIERMVYLPSPALYGYLTYKILIRANTVHPNLRERLHETIRKHPHVTVLVECLGSWNFEIGIEVRTFKDAQKIAQELKDLYHPLIEIVDIIQRTEKLKESCYPFK